MTPAQEAWYAANHNRRIEAQRDRRRRKAYGLEPIGRAPVRPLDGQRRGQNEVLKDWLLDNTNYGKQPTASRLDPHF